MTPRPVCTNGAGGELIFHGRAAGRAFVLLPATSLTRQFKVKSLGVAVITKPPDLWFITTGQPNLLGVTVERWRTRTMKPQITTALSNLLVLFGVAEQGTMPEPLESVEEECHHEGNECQEAKADGSTEDGDEAVWEEGEEESHHPEASEDFRNGRAVGHLLSPSSRLELRCLAGA